MSGPWEDYQKADSKDQGPWEDYRSDRKTKKDYIPPDNAPKVGAESFGESFRKEVQETPWAGRNLAALGSGLSNLYEGAKQLVGKGDKQRIEANKILQQEAPTGAIAGDIAAYAPLAVIPGANGVLGAAAIGAGTGFLQPTDKGMLDRIKNAAISAALGGGLAKAGNMAGNLIATKQGAKAITKPGFEQAKKAQDLGYALPPSEANPNWFNKGMGGWAGKLTTQQQASLKNQKVTNDLIEKELGGYTKNDAYAAYDKLKGIGTIKASKNYKQALDKIASSYTGAAKSFPGAAKNDVVGLVNSLKVKSFDPDAAIEMTKILREDAAKAFRQGNSPLARANKEASTAIEDEIERHLSKKGQTKTLDDFKEARKKLAQIYEVEKATTKPTGNISAQALAKSLNKGKPLTGGLRDVAEFGSSFGKSSQLPEKVGAPPGISPLDVATGLIGGAHGGNPEALGAMLFRPLIRSMILSKPYQKLFARAPTQLQLTPEQIKMIEKLIRSSVPASQTLSGYYGNEDSSD